jgi:hypothetical protein
MGARLAECDDRVDLHLSALGKGHHADCRARRRRIAEERGVGVVDLGEALQPRGVDRQAKRAGELGAGRLADGGEVAQAVRRLVGQRALDVLPGGRVERDLAGAEEEVAVGDRLGRQWRRRA